MATIATLNVLLTAGTAQFTKGLSKAQSALATFGKSITSTKALLGGLATGAVVVGFTRIVGGALEAIEQTGNLADAIGMPVEALSKLQHAAKLNGTELETLNTGLEKMMRTLGEAGQGSKTALKAFDEIGLSARELVNMSPDEAFGEIAEAINGIHNPAQRAAAIMDIFGKSGLKLANLLALGKAGLKSMGDEAKRLGVVLTAIDVAKVREANDAIDRIKAVFQGFVQQIAIQLAPFIEHAANAFTAWATSGEGAAVKVANAIASVGNAIAATADGLQGLTNQLLEVQLTALKVRQFFVDMKKDEALNIAAGGPEQMKGHEDIIRKAKQLEEAVASVEKSIANSRAATSWGDSVREKMKGIQDAANAAAQASVDAKPKFESIIPPAVIDKLTHLKDKLIEAQQTFGMTSNQILAWRIGIEGADDATKQWAMDTANAIDALDRMHQAMATLADKRKQVFDETRTPMEKLNQKFDELNQLFDHGERDWETYSRAMRSAAADYLDFIDATKSRPEALEFGSAAAESAINAAMDMASAEEHVRRLMREGMGRPGIGGPMEPQEPGIPEMPEEAFDDFATAMDEIMRDDTEEVVTAIQGLVPLLQDIGRNTHDSNTVVAPL